MSAPYKSFRAESPPNKSFLTIITHCTISEAFDPTNTPQPKTNGYKGLWDTGATNTVISKKVAIDLNLNPRGKVTSFHADGQSNVETYYINIGLPNGVGFQYVRVTEGKLKDFDVLIGMDIIGAGEFSLKHENNKHVFEFKLPTPKISQPTAPIPIDPNAIPKVGRNEPCPCDSGKKYKNCHGVGQ